MKTLTHLLFFVLFTTHFVLDAQTSSCGVSSIPINCSSGVLTGSTVGNTSNFNINDYACHSSDAAYTAGDQVYSLSIATPTEVNIRIVGAGGNLDLFVFENNCSPGNCIRKSTGASSSESISFDASAGTYHIVIDGSTTASEAQFRMSVGCDRITNGGDDDDDDDDDDPNSFSCTNLPALACGNTYNLSNTSAENLLERNSYLACVSGTNTILRNYDGQDLTYRISVPANRELVLEMSGLRRDLDMFLFDGCSGSTLSSCLATSLNSGTADEYIVLPASNSTKTYYLAIDGHSLSQTSNFTLKVDCRLPCSQQVDSDCDDLSFFYAGGDVYDFKVPFSLPYTGIWTATNSAGQVFDIGTGRSTRARFNYRGTYKICYTYQDASSCDISCCRTIYLGADPSDCDEIEQEYDSHDDEWLLSLPHVPNANVLYWLNNDTGARLASNTNDITIDEPNTGQCYDICVYYKDPATGVYQVCCVTICEGDACVSTPLSISCSEIYQPVCGCDDNQYQNSCFARKAGVLAWTAGPCAPQVDADCDDLDFSFLSALRYSFSVPADFPSGNWIAAGSGYNNQTVVLGNSNNIIISFPEAGTYTVCYEYVENGQTKQCCRTLSVLADPYECRDLRRTIQGSTTTIFIPGIASEDVVRWRNDSTDEELATATDRITVPIPASGSCGNYSVLFYDAGCDCFRVCCIQICTQESDEVNECAEVQNAAVTCLDEAVFNYSFTLKNNSGLSNLTASVTILTSIGPTFENCSNVANITGVNESVDVSLDLVECIVPVQSGMEVTYKVTLKDTQGTFFCELDPMMISLPTCEEVPAVSCESACVGEDLVTNGDFEGGYWAFTSELDPKCFCSTASYCISTDATNKCNDWNSLTSDGKFLIVEADALAPSMIWTQDVEVEAGKDYSFTFDTYANITGDTIAPELELWVGDSLIAMVAGNLDTWTTLNSNWTANGAGILDISIRQSEGAGVFGIDNIRFTACNATTGDPLQDVAWLQSFVGVTSTEIAQCVDEGEVLYQIVEDCGATDVTSVYYDCNGNAICSIGIGGSDCPDDIISLCTILQSCAANLPNTQFATSVQPTGTKLTNYPNPFRNSTTIEFYLPEYTQASLSVFDTNGRQVFLRTANFEAGQHQMELDASKLSGGVYYYRLETASESITKTMLMLE